MGAPENSPLTTTDLRVVLKSQISGYSDLCLHTNFPFGLVHWFSNFTVQKNEKIRSCWVYKSKPVAVPYTRDSAVNKTDKDACLSGLCVLVGKT